MTAEEWVREGLVWVTGFIPDPDVAGMTFALSLVATDHVFCLMRKVWP